MAYKCLECGHDKFLLSSEAVTLTVHGVEFTYDELIVECSSCGEEVYIPEINDANVDIRFAAYKKAIGEKGEHDDS